MKTQVAFAGWFVLLGYFLRLTWARNFLPSASWAENQNAVGTSWSDQEQEFSWRR